MALFVMTPETVWNPAALELRSSPRKILERIAILPRREAGWRVVARVIFENQFLRYLVALLPFVAAMFIWPHLALPISQAPIPMLIVVGFVEMRLLRPKKEARAAITTEDAAARTLDQLNFRGRKLLAEIAARRQESAGELYLVVEQSEIAKVPPLTIVTVQTGEGRNRLVALDHAERALIRERLFDDELTERALHAANLREDVHLRAVRFDLRAVSGHARLAAKLKARAAEEAVA